jgi:group I intron endonuclease
MMIKGSGIYQIYNIVSGKVYIGSAVRLYYRLANHKHRLKNNKHYNKYLQASWNLHGEEVFEFRILEIVEDKFKLIEREQFWIDFYNSADRDYGYNLYPKAKSALGYKHSIETKLKVSKASSSKRNSIETRKKISDSNKGKIMSESSRLKMSLAKRGDKSCRRNKLKYPCLDGYKCKCDTCMNTKRERNRIILRNYRQKMQTMGKVVSGK